MKCNELMVGDWITDEYKLPMRVYHVDRRRAYADSGCTLYEFNKDYPPQPIEITSELLKANGWEEYSVTLFHNFKEYERKYVRMIDEKGNHLEYRNGKLFIWFDYKEGNEVYNIIFPCKYVHQLQQVLRFAGMTELANNFKIII